MATIGNYRVLTQIGEGGFGRVFQAEHLVLGEKACLKQNINSSVEDVELLKHEVKLLWNLDEYHSIPSVKDFIQLDRTNAVLVMKYIDGKTLEDIVEKKGPLYPEDACWITERLLGALFYAHCYGTIHSDVKPQNVFVEPRKHDIKLIDFGLASYKPGSHTKPAGYTPKYAAPELVNGNPPIPQTDLYGVGMVMLRALGGDIAKKSFRSDTPEEITEFCNELLRYNPLERPSWEKNNPLERLANVREKVFGRRHSSDDKLKGGGM
ncbi:MAG: serine/threonine-protein kinase [Nanoarchaeota archaeon]|nr:serine/threonine-protein kinase [Nanoarchaeota archaeon]